MQKKILLFLFLIQFSLIIIAQPPRLKYVIQKGYSVSFSALLPLGEFSLTHWGGIAVGYSPDRVWFTRYQPKNKIRFTYNGGLAYYFGKNETVSGYVYDYPGYLFIHAFAGAMYVPEKKADIRLTAGPALGVYSGNTRFTIGSKLEGTYYISEKIAIGPGIIMMKESGADPLWSLALKGTYTF